MIARRLPQRGIAPLVTTCLMCLFSIAFPGLSARVSAEDYRTWKDSTGKFSREAAFRRIDGEMVRLRLSGSDKAITIPLVKLSAADQAYAREAEKQATTRRIAYAARLNDLAMAKLFAFREAEQTHLLASTLGLGCLQGLPEAEVRRLCELGLGGYESLSMPLLRKYLDNAEHDEQTQKHFALILSRQQLAFAELRAVKALAESGNGDKERSTFNDARLGYEEAAGLPWEAFRQSDGPNAANPHRSVVSDSRHRLTPVEAAAMAHSGKEVLNLSYVATLSPEIAGILGKSKASVLNLSGITELSDQAAELLSQRKIMEIRLDGLEKVSDHAVHALTNGKCSYLHLNNVRTVSPEAFSRIADSKTNVLIGIETLPLNAAQLLTQKCPSFFWCRRLAVIPDDVLEVIVSKADRVALGLKRLTKQQAAILSRLKGELFLDSLEMIDADAAELLAEHNGQLSLAGIEQISDEARRALSRHEKPVNIGGDVDVWEEFSRESNAFTLQRENRHDAAVMVLAFSFREAAQTHVLAHALALSAVAGRSGNSLSETHKKALAGFAAESIPALGRYLVLVKHDEKARQTFEAVTELRRRVAAELLAVGAMIDSGNGQSERRAFIEANRAYNDIVESVAAALVQPERLFAQQGGQRGPPDGDGGPDESILSDDEWAGVVAGLQRRGLLRAPEDAKAYFGTFAMLKSVFVQKRINEPTTGQLFALAKALNVAFGQMAPEKIETTLRTMLHLAKETSTEVAGRQMLLDLKE